jgi:predicted dehydrogenase
MNQPVLTVVVVGVGHMGASHARAYANIPGYKVIGFVVSLNISRAGKLASDLGLSIPVYTDFYQAINELKPDVVSINTHPDTHAPYAIYAMEHGCHVFVEKPIALTVAEAETVADVAKRMERVLLVGYILRVHPTWQKFIQLGRGLGKPVVMRLNLNQQSSGQDWQNQKNSIAVMPPIVSCGVHYMDVMCQVTGEKPTSVHCMAARLSGEIGEDKRNYWAMHIAFNDGSVGWFEVGWGPMISNVASSVKDISGPRGSVSFRRTNSIANPSDISLHASVGTIVLHSSSLGRNNAFTVADEEFATENEPDHNALCRLEQECLYSAIMGETDLSGQLESAVSSLKICLAAVESYQTGEVIPIK